MYVLHCTAVCSVQWWALIIIIIAWNVQTTTSILLGYSQLVCHNNVVDTCICLSSNSTMTKQKTLAESVFVAVVEAIC